MSTKYLFYFIGILGCGKSQLALKYAIMFRKNHHDGLCWRITCQNNITLLNSLNILADALDIEKEKTTQNENKQIGDSIDILCQLILIELNKGDSSQHLIILEDVTDQTKHATEKLKTSLLKKGIRTIVTTCNYAFCDEDDTIAVSGFTVEEAVAFLQEKKESRPEEEKHYQDLAKQLSYLPLLLYGARTCMRKSRQSPKRFIKYIKGTKSLSNIDKFVRSSSEPSENRELFKKLCTYLEILQEEEGKDVFDMILVLQFLGLEDIPVLLLDFLPTDNGLNHRGLNTTNFIQAIQKFSFAMLRGEDDDRLFNVHFAVIKSIAQFTSMDDKVRLIRKLLIAFMWLMDKDNYDPKDYKRNNMLLPHAISVLQNVKILQEKCPRLRTDFEFNILLAYVYDIVGYTYNFFGILKNAGEYSTAAKEACFALVGIPEKEIENTVCQTIVCDNHHKTWENFADSEVTRIFEKLQEKMSDPVNKELLDQMAKQFLLNKYRGHDHIALLQGYIEDELEEEYILTEMEYQQLRKRELTIPEDQLGVMFLYEVVLQVFYTFGRRVFYLGDGFEKGIARTFSHYLFLARALGKKIAVEYPKWRLLYVMLTELSGTLEQMFDDKADLQLKSLENLEYAAEQFQQLLELDTTFFNFGLVKSEPGNSQHKHICYKRLVRSYTNMAKLVSTSDDAKRKEIHDKGLVFFKKLEDYQRSCREVISANLRMAEFLLQLKYYEDAETKFMFVAPEDMIEEDEEMKTTMLNNHELQALKGLTKCYCESGKMELARSLAQRVKDRLEVNNEDKELEYFKKMLLDLKLSE